MQHIIKTEENLKKLVKKWQQLGIPIDLEKMPIALDFTYNDIFSLTKEDVVIILEVCQELADLDELKDQELVEAAYKVYLQVFN